jgi:hypothetical protein
MRCKFLFFPLALPFLVANLNACTSKLADSADSQVNAAASGESRELAVDSILKMKPVQSNLLNSEEKCPLPSGTKIIFLENPNGSDESHAFAEVQGLLPAECNAIGLSKGYIFKEHIQGSQTTRLNVPYFCQMHNVRFRPSATCSNTALAMVLAFYGKTSLTGRGTLADQIFERHGILNSVDLIRSGALKEGLQARVHIPGSFDTIKREIDAGRPVIVGGDFVGRVGHFVVVVGYDKEGFLVHDPYGKWDQSTVSPFDGYRSNLCNNGFSGKDRHYSYTAMRKAAGNLGFYLVTIRP